MEKGNKEGRYEEQDRVTWYKSNAPHRLDGPAVEFSDGGEIWYRYGKIHRDDGPAIIRADGSMEYWVDGSRHRENGPAIIRTDKNTIVAILFGTQVWMKHHATHRVDGPAIIYPDGREEYWLYGKSYSKQDFSKFHDAFMEKCKKSKPSV